MKGRTGQIIIGAVLVVVAIAGFYAFSLFLAPPAHEVFVAVQEMNQGDQLTPDRVQLVSVRSRESLEGYIMRDEIEQFGYGTLVEPIHVGEFVPKAAVAVEGNPAATNRVALALADPNEVVKVVPVTTLTSPEDIVPGDIVDLTLSVGSATFLTGALEVVPTASPLEAYRYQYYSSGVPTVMPEQSVPVITPTPTGQPNNLPITKDIVVGAKVIKVLYEVKANPNYMTGSADTHVSSTVRGDIRALVVGVPRSVVEILDYGIQNGTLRVSVRHPGSAPGKDGVSPGVSWDDLAAYFKWERQLWQLTPMPEEVYGPGAQIVVATLQATLFPTPTAPPQPAATSTPVPSATP